MNFFILFDFKVRLNLFSTNASGEKEKLFERSVILKLFKIK